MACKFPPNGTHDTQLVREFFVAVVNHSQMTPLRQLDGNSHHIIEATFKAFARSLRIAVEIDPRRAGTIQFQGRFAIN